MLIIKETKFVLPIDKIKTLYERNTTTNTVIYDKYYDILIYIL